MIIVDNNTICYAVRHHSWSVVCKGHRLQFLAGILYGALPRDQFHCIRRLSEEHRGILDVLLEVDDFDLLSTDAKKQIEETWQIFAQSGEVRFVAIQ